MSRKIFAAALALIVTLTIIAASLNHGGRAAAQPPSSSSVSELLSMLPASDAVAFVDVQRALSDVVPRLFVSDSDSIARINREIEKFQNETGADPRQFDVIAIGVRFGKSGTFTPEVGVGLVRGRFAASELIASGVAKAKADTKVQPKEEEYEGATIYGVGKTMRGMCVAAMDSNTIVFGDEQGVRAALEARSGRGAHVNSSLVELATLNQNAVVGFSGNLPASAGQSVNKPDDFSRALQSIRQVYGSADATGTTGALSVNLRTETKEQAEELAEKIVGLKALAGMTFSPQKTSDQEQGTQSATLVATPSDQTVRSLPFPPKWIKDVTIVAEGNEVKLRLEEPFAEIAPFIRSF